MTGTGRRAPRARSRRPGAPGGFLLLPVALVIAVVAAVAWMMAREGALALNTAAGERAPEDARFVAEAGLAHALWRAQASACTGYGLPATAFGNASYQASFTPASGSPVEVAATGTLASGPARTLRRAAVPVHDMTSVQTLTVQPDPAAGRDAYVTVKPNDANTGAYEFLAVEYGTRRHALLAFDLDALPRGAKLIRAELSLRTISVDVGPAPAIRAHRLLEPWTEAGVTYQTPDGTAAWTWPANHDAATVAATAVPASAPPDHWLTWDITGLVSAWHAASAPNHGLVLMSNADIYYAQFHSSEALDPANRPKLTLTYACECGGNRYSEVLAPDAGAGLDTYLNDGPQADTNYATDGFLSASSTAASDHGLVRFALDAVPPGATLESAALTLSLVEIGSANSGTASVHPVTRGWLESQATWNEAAAGSPWSVPGGDFDAAVATVAIDAAAPGPRTFDVTTTVSEWLQGSRPNHGLAVVAGPGISRANFASSDYFDAAQHPRLTLTWSCPCGVDCGPATPCSSDFLGDNTVSSVATTGYGSASVQGLGWLPEGASFAGATAPPGGAWLSLDADRTLSVVDAAGALLASCTLADPGAQPTGVTWVASGTWSGHAAVSWDGALIDRVAFVDGACAEVAGFDTRAYGQSSPSGIAHIGATASGRHEGHLAVADNGSKSIFIVDQAGALQRTLDVSSMANGVTAVAHLARTDRLLFAHASKAEAYRVDFDGASHGLYDTAARGAASPHGLAVDAAACRHALADPTAAVLVAVDSVAGSGTSVTLAPSQDTFLGGESPSASGTNTSLFAGFGSREWRPLLRFDLSGLPPGALLLSAKLRLHNWNDGSPTQGPVTLDAHRVLESWTATWGGSKGANWYGREKQGGGETPWTTPGGTHDGALAGSASFDASASPQWIELDVRPLAQEWLDGVSPNHGVLLVPQPGSAWANLRSADFPDPLLRPQLVLEYVDVPAL